MNAWFADLPIRWKLTALTALSTTLVLAIGAAVLGAYQATMFRRALAQKIATEADIVGRNSTAALAFSPDPGGRNPRSPQPGGPSRVTVLE